MRALPSCFYGSSWSEEPAEGIEAAAIIYPQLSSVRRETSCLHRWGVDWQRRKGGNHAGQVGLSARAALGKYVTDSMYIWSDTVLFLI